MKLHVIDGVMWCDHGHQKQDLMKVVDLQLNVRGFVSSLNSTTLSRSTKINAHHMVTSGPLHTWTLGFDSRGLAHHLSPFLASCLLCHIAYYVRLHPHPVIILFAS